MKVREIIRRLEADGWYPDRTRGSHRRYKHASKPGVVTVPGHPNEDLQSGTVSSIFRQAGLPKP